MRRPHNKTVPSALLLAALFALACVVTLPAAPPVRNVPVPSDGKGYLGLTFRAWDSTDPRWGDARPFADRYPETTAREFGTGHPTVFGVPSIWQDDAGHYDTFEIGVQPSITAFQAFDPALIPVISWSAQTGWSASPTGGISTQTIMTGAQDAYITAFAQAIKHYKRPVFLRAVCGEINLDYAEHCSQTTDHARAAQSFVAAWRRVVTIFRQGGVTNVSWTWNVNTFPPPPSDWGIDPHIDTYYPGDEYVDWVTADHYDYGPIAWLDPIEAFARAHGKPFGVVEWGVRHAASTLAPTEQETWIDDMFRYAEAHPSLKLLQYFDYDMGATPFDAAESHVWLYDGVVNYRPFANDFDHRLLAESDAHFRSLFAAWASTARYQIP